MTIMAPLGLQLGGHYATQKKRKEGGRGSAAMKMLVGSHQGRNAGGCRERHNTQSSGDARCHDRQTAAEVRWVSLLSGKKWRGKGWLRRGGGNSNVARAQWGHRGGPHWLIVVRHSFSGAFMFFKIVSRGLFPWHFCSIHTEAYW